MEHHSGKPVEWSSLVSTGGVVLEYAIVQSPTSRLTKIAAKCEERCDGNMVVL